MLLSDIFLIHISLSCLGRLILCSIHRNKCTLFESSWHHIQQLIIARPCLLVHLFLNTTVSCMTVYNKNGPRFFNCFHFFAFSGIIINIRHILFLVLKGVLVSSAWNSYLFGDSEWCGSYPCESCGANALSPLSQICGMTFWYSQWMLIMYLHRCLGYCFFKDFVSIVHITLLTVDHVTTSWFKYFLDGFTWKYYIALLVCLVILLCKLIEIIIIFTCNSFFADL